MRLDPQAPADQPQVVLLTYTGGAHCCTIPEVFELTGGRWRDIVVGKVNGDLGVGEPKRLADGWAFILPDIAFDYEFQAHAFSVLPTQVLRVEQSKLVNDATSAAAKAILVPEIAQDRDACAQHANPSCAAYAALAGRTGHYTQAMAFVRAHYDTASNEYPHQRCGDQVLYQDCPKGVEKPVKDFPEALDLFLHDSGYAPGTVRLSNAPGL